MRTFFANRPLRFRWRSGIFTTAILFELFCAYPIFSQHFVRIPELRSQNPIFLQYQDEVEEANKALAHPEKEPLLNFYTYVAGERDTLFTISSRCSIPYDTIATANGITDATLSLAGREILLPTVEGIFIPQEPQTSLDILLAADSENLAAVNGGSAISLVLNGKSLYFLKGRKARLSPSQRAFFLDTAFRLPLAKSVLTSPFGMRKSPISGSWKFHHGVDLAAPLGTNIFACKSGSVEQVVQNDIVYGNYVVLRHSGGFSSLYAHMSVIAVQKGQNISAGAVVGKIGTTGMSTGPHLHFELRQNGQSQNPDSYLPSRK